MQVAEDGWELGFHPENLGTFVVSLGGRLGSFCGLGHDFVSGRVLGGVEYTLSISESLNIAYEFVVFKRAKKLFHLVD